MDERVLTVLKAVALHDDKVCELCMSSPTYTHKEDNPPFTLLVHEHDCPVILARNLLCEHGTPANTYLVQYEEFTRNNKWESQSYCLIDMNEQEVKFRVMDSMGYTSFSNLSITFAMPLGEAKE